MLSTRGELGYVITDVASGGLTADLIDKLQGLPETGRARVLAVRDIRTPQYPCLRRLARRISGRQPSTDSADRLQDHQASTSRPRSAQPAH